MATHFTSLKKLVDMSVGTADINFQLLHSLLRAIVSAMDYEHMSIEIDDDAQIMDTFAKKKAVRYIDVDPLKDGEALRINYAMADFPDRPSRRGEKKADIDVLAMFEQMNIGKRMDSAEMAIAKVTSLIHKLMRQLDTLQSNFENFQSMVQNQLAKLEDFMLETERRMDQLSPGGDSAEAAALNALSDRLTELETAMNERFEALERLFNERLDAIQAEFQQSLLCLLKQLGAISEEIRRLLHLEETLAMLIQQVQGNKEEFEQHLSNIRRWQAEADMRLEKMRHEIIEFQERTEEILAADIRERKRQYGYFVDHLEGVKATKADMEDVERLLDAKASRAEMNTRVSIEVFEREFKLISNELSETVICFKALESNLKNLASDILLGLNKKADKVELGRIRCLVDTKMQWLAKVCVADEEMKESCIVCDEIKIFK